MYKSFGLKRVHFIALLSQNYSKTDLSVVVAEKPVYLMLFKIKLIIKIVSYE